MQDVAAGVASHQYSLWPRGTLCDEPLLTNACLLNVILAQTDLLQGLLLRYMLINRVVMRAAVDAQTCRHSINKVGVFARQKPVFTVSLTESAIWAVLLAASVAKAEAAPKLCSVAATIDFMCFISITTFMCF